MKNNSQSNPHSGINSQAIAADKLFRALTDKKYRLFRHILGILFLFFLLTVGKKWGEFTGFFDHLHWILALAFIVSMFYINMYRLTPYFIYRGKALLYLISLGSLNIIGFIILAVFQILIIEPNRALYPSEILTADKVVPIALFLTFLLAPFILLTTTIKLMQRWVQDIAIINELEERAVESELAALRSQMHPHFLFNMLNNINVLTATEPEKASYIIVKLSNFLRHLIYETDRSQIFLSSEIKFMNDYLELEKIRRDDFTYCIQYDEKEIRGLKLPPNILIVLVENAIKHSADPNDGSYVNIGLAKKEGSFHFTAVNSLPKKTKPNNKNSSGAGLVNIKRRLELLYADGYELNCFKEDRQYSAFLRLPL
ncbi:sensor histidine kinase [Flavobacterium sp. HJSW_4]|uniref:sensor histidine kinase n=1 Tax=Flavobacterium sp. HJSW_4 TaxID=3344660 RepID=UPI0035F26ABA